MPAHQKVTAFRARKKSGPPIAALTAWDYPTARLLDEAGADLILVGDSLGMVVLGFPDTTHVTIEHMIHHTAAVARGSKNALLVADFAINTYNSAEQAVANARTLVAAGAEAVKLEGGVRQAGKVRAIVDEGIEVMGHLGMLPQRVKEEGGYKKKGKSGEEISALLEGAQALQEAGCFGIVLESVVPEVAIQLTASIDIPTIGIGCGVGTCDGEIAVTSDVIGSYPWFVPPFATPRANVAGEISKAVQAYVAAPRNRSLPAD
ncbi:MAG: 3-methyl-2-oxobutanoate hydroxymethyltransferase [Akkermansiaceae bacterium]